MKKTLFASLFACLLILSSCSDDDDKEDLIDFTVSFSNAAVGLSEQDATADIMLTYSRPATEVGTISVTYTGSNADYGTDFTTSPDGSSGTISIPVAIGDASSTFTFTKLQDAIEGTTKSVSFTIDGFDNVDWMEGATTDSEVSFTPIAATSGVIDAETGGSNYPNQVYVDLSTGIQTAVRRDTWEIAFYNGTENRVYLNSSLLVAAAELDGINDLLSVTEETNLTTPLELLSYNQPVTVNTVAELIQELPVAYTQYGNSAENLVFTDNKEGTLEGTAFAEISTTADNNNVYIVSLGSEIPTEPAETGSAAHTGLNRGFMKVRVLSDGDSYTVQYAALDETSNFNEVTVQKNDAFSLSAFSLSQGETVSVEPEKDKWDINISGVFSFYDRGFGLTYTDYALHNTLGDVGLYQVTLYSVDSETGERTDFDVPSYADFSMADVAEAELVYDDRAVIGSGWRSVFGPNKVVKDDRYFVLKDASGNYYKILFTAFLNAQGERGFPQFTYERL